MSEISETKANALFDAAVVALTFTGDVCSQLRDIQYGSQGLLKHAYWDRPKDNNKEHITSRVINGGSWWFPPYDVFDFQMKATFYKKQLAVLKAWHKDGLWEIHFMDKEIAWFPKIPYSSWGDDTQPRIVYANEAMVANLPEMVTWSPSDLVPIKFLNGEVSRGIMRQLYSTLQALKRNASNEEGKVDWIYHMILTDYLTLQSYFVFQKRE